MTTRSISDDDLCSDCTHCGYKPGDDSSCNLDWPCEEGPSEYVRNCGTFKTEFVRH